MVGVAENTGAANGEPRNDVSSWRACVDLCAEDSRCKAIDWDYQATVKCWFHSGEVLQWKQASGVNHYIIVDRCPSRKSRLYH